MLRFDAVPELVKTLLLRLAVMAKMREFALGGGTSLALRFGHRMSVDLDFFTLHEFDSEVFRESLEIDAVTVSSQAANSVTLDVGGVKVDLLRHAYRMLGPVERINEVALLSLPDTAAMKLNAIANRGSKKDFYDMVELLDHLALPQMILYFTEKYPATDPFTVIRSLAWFEDAEAEPDPISLKGVTWTVVKAKMSMAVAGL
jgi:predicted nucleotidyltransferase component of viral defense system